jgi:hypothetical protein
MERTKALEKLLCTRMEATLLKNPSIGVTAAWTVVRGILIAGTLTVQAIKPAFHNSTIALSGRGAGNSLAHCG